MDQQKQKQAEELKLKESSIIKELREEIAILKKWKESAIIETVDKDRLALWHFSERHLVSGHLAKSQLAICWPSPILTQPCQFLCNLTNLPLVFAWMCDLGANMP